MKLNARTRAWATAAAGVALVVLVLWWAWQRRRREGLGENTYNRKRLLRMLHQHNKMNAAKYSTWNPETLEQAEASVAFKYSRFYDDHVTDSRESAMLKRKYGNWAGVEGKLGFYRGRPGAKSACGARLQPYKSLAVRPSMWQTWKGHRVEIPGVCNNCVVDDVCNAFCGGDFEMFVGQDTRMSRPIPALFKMHGKKYGHPCRYWDKDLTPLEKYFIKQIDAEKRQEDEKKYGGYSGAEPRKGKVKWWERVSHYVPDRRE